MSDRPMTSLGNLAEVNPPVPPHALRNSDPVSFIPMEDVSESARWTNRQTRPLGRVRRGYTAFSEGDVLVAKITPCLENGKGCHAVGLVGGIGYGTTEFHVLRARKGANARLVYHLTTDPTFRVRAESQMTGSAGQQRVPTAFLVAYPVPAFTGEEQDAIAEVLDAADAEIERAEAGIDKRRRVLTGLLHDLLARGLDAAGRRRAEATHAFRDTPLGRLPEDWNVLTLGEATSYISRGKSPVYADLSPHAVLNQACVFSSGLRLSNLKYVTAAYWDGLSPARRLQSGDVLINSTGAGTLGRVGYYSGPGGRLTYDSHVTVLRVDSGRHEAHYLFQEIQAPRVQQQIEAFCISGSTNQTELSKTALQTVQAAFPPLDEQRRIVAVLDAAEAEIAREVAMLAKLRRIKAGLLRDLLTGRVPVDRLLASARPA